MIFGLLDASTNHINRFFNIPLFWIREEIIGLNWKMKRFVQVTYGLNLMEKKYLEHNICATSCTCALP